MSNKIRLSVFVLSSVFYLGFAAVSVYAETKDLAPKFSLIADPNLPRRTGVKAKPLIVHTGINTQVQFDSNVFLTNKLAKFDTITLLNPSIGLELPMGENNMAVEYDVGFNFFGHYPHHNYQDHRVQGLAEFNFTYFKVKVKNVYRRFSSRSGSEDTNRVARQTNVFRAGISHEFEKLGYDIGYTFGADGYISKEPIYGILTYKDKDMVYNLFDGEVSYKFAPKTAALFEAVIGFNNYYSPLSPNSWFIETLGGIRGQITSKITSTWKAGLRYQDYSDNSFTASKDFCGFVSRGGLIFKATDRDNLELKLENSVYESTFENMNYYNVNHIGLDYEHLFTKKVSGKLFGFYQLNLYPSETTVGTETAKRYDNFLSGGCSLRYDIRTWISLEARYEYLQRLSRFSDFDYIDNLITMRGTIGF